MFHPVTVRNLLAVFVGMLISCTASVSTAGPCTFANGNHANTERDRPYKINLNSFDAIPTISQDEAQTAVVQAADLWGRQANSGTLRYIGNTTDKDLPDTKVLCDALGVDHSIVVVDPTTCSNLDAEVSAECVDSATGVAHAYVITIFTKGSNAACSPIVWHVGDNSTNLSERDLVNVLVHEFGHTYNLGHTLDPSVMSNGWPRRPGRRDLFEWDINCVSDNGGVREFNLWFAWQVMGLLGPMQWSPNYVAKASPGKTWHSGVEEWASAFSRTFVTECLGFNSNFWTSSGTECLSASDSEDVPIGPVEVTYREEAILYDHIAWSEKFDTAAAIPNLEADHFARMAWSKDGFDLDESDAAFQTCTQMQGYYSCHVNDRETITTAQRIAFSYDGYTDRTVAVWTHMDRNGDTLAVKNNRKLRVAYGQVDRGVVPVASDLGVRSTVGPGIACEPFQAGGYDCIVAYTDASETLGRVKIKRFWGILTDTTHHTPVIEPATHEVSAGARTGSDIAVWAHDGLFWLAIRPIDSFSQDAQLWASPDGSSGSWSFKGSVGYSATSLAAVSYHNTGDNVLFYIAE